MSEAKDYFINVVKGSYEYLYPNYDYCYLDAMHYKNRQQGADVMVVGSSHAMNGIVETVLGAGDKDIINYSISSQDLYYDYLHIEKAIREGKKHYETCIVNIGYYMLYQDVSLSRNIEEMIPRVYYPLFQDKHNYGGDLKVDMMEQVSIIENVDAQLLLYQDWARKFLSDQGTYYGGAVTRKDKNILGLKKVNWYEMTENEKEEYAKGRAGGHNKQRKHIVTYEESKQMIMKIAKLLYENQIRCVFLICPFTQYYNQYISAEFKLEIFQILDELEYPVELYDINEMSDVFSDEDFLDSDHLSDTGAEKLSLLLREII